MSEFGRVSKKFSKISTEGDCDLCKINAMTESHENTATEGDKKKSADSKREASWPSVLFFIHLNILGLYGIVVLFTNAKIITILFCEYAINSIDHQFIRFSDSFYTNAHGNLRDNRWRSSIVDSSNLQSKWLSSFLADDLANDGWSGKHRKKKFLVMQSRQRRRKKLRQT